MLANRPHLPSVADARDSLRRATAALHDRVDACMPLSRPHPVLGDYQRHLTLLRAWTEILCQRRPALAPRLAQEADAIDADLAACERLLGTPAQRVPAMPLPSRSEAADDDGFDWGVTYVLEGSRLGGQVLHRRLAQPLSPHPLDYLRGAGSDTGARWKAFLGELADALDTQARVQRACDGAVMAFDILLQCHANSDGDLKAVPR